MNNLSGLIPSPPDQRDFPVGSIVPKVELPIEIRLDHDILKVLNQGFFPTCVGKAGNGIMSSGFNNMLSSLFLYAKCKELDGIPALHGTFPRVAMKVMQKYGVCLERLLPYEVLTDHNHLPELSKEMLKDAQDYRITKYARVTGLDDIKQALANGHMIMGAMLLGDNFMQYRSGILGKATGNQHGYHAVIFCGYNDDKGAIRGLNSWGASWGEKGFFWLSYDVLANRQNFIEGWIVETEKREPYVYPDRIYRCLDRYLRKLRR